MQVHFYFMANQLNNRDVTGKLKTLILVGAKGFTNAHTARSHTARAYSTKLGTVLLEGGKLLLLEPTPYEG